MRSTLRMCDRADAAALRLLLRSLYLTEERACCHSLHSMAFVRFENECLQAMRLADGGPRCATLLAGGVRLEYREHSVVVSLSEVAPTPPALCTGKRATPER